MSDPSRWPTAMEKSGMPEQDEIPISPKHRAFLDRWEALHARGFWPFAVTFLVCFLLPMAFCLLILEVLLYHAFGVGGAYCDLAAMGNVVAASFLVLLFCGLFVITAWKLTPWLVRKARSIPDYTAGQNESWRISAVGFGVVFGLCIYAGYSARSDEPFSDTLMVVVGYGWIVGIVILLWGWWRWTCVRKEDPNWAKRSLFDRTMLRLAHPLLLASLVALILAVLQSIGN